MRCASFVLLAAFASVLAASASAAPADSPASPQTTATTVSPVALSPKPTVSPDDVVVCHTEEDLGSRIPGPRTCHTRRQWREIAAAARDTVDSYESRGDTVNNMKGN